MKKKAKRVIKQVLKQAGIDLELAAKLGIRTVRRSDTFIVSYPKSGNTWARFLLANTMLGDREATFHDLDDFVPDVHRSQSRIDRIRRRRLIKSHFAYCSEYPRFVYIYRDGRDVMVSFYHFKRQLGRFEGSFAKFIRSRHANVFGKWRWHEHVSAALQERERRPRDVLLLKYEDMLVDPLSAAGDLVAFCRIPASQEQVADAVASCSFDSLRRVEETYGGAGDLDRFMRKGTSGQWPTYFSQSDLDYFYNHAGRALERLGYSH